MPREKEWQFELEEYIRQGEPEKVEKSEAWQTAIGLQAVDGLSTSEYLLDTAKDHIDGKITIDEAQKRIQSYYEQRADRTVFENTTKEADIVSSRIANLLLDTDYELKNRYMHVDYVDESNSQSVNDKAPKSQFDTLKCSLEELAVLELIVNNPNVKQQELVEKTGKSLSTVKRTSGHRDRIVFRKSGICI